MPQKILKNPEKSWKILKIETCETDQEMTSKPSKNPEKITAAILVNSPSYARCGWKSSPCMSAADIFHKEKRTAHHPTKPQHLQWRLGIFSYRSGHHPTERSCAPNADVVVPSSPSPPPPDNHSSFVFFFFTQSINNQTNAVQHLCAVKTIDILPGPRWILLANQAAATTTSTITTTKNGQRW